VTRTAGPVDLPAAQDLATIPGVTAIKTGPHPDWMTIAGGSVCVAGVGDENGTQVGRYQTSTAELQGLVRIGQKRMASMIFLRCACQW